jgi:hypothetical protein
MPRTFTTGQGTGSDATKKVGVGGTADIQWYNFQVPFGLEAGQDWWTYNNLVSAGENNTRIAPSGVSSGAIAVGQGWMINPSTFAVLGFNDGVQVIFQEVVNVDNTTGGADTATAGIGFGENNGLGQIAAMQGSLVVRAAFCRDTLGQWYASVSDGAGFTENPIALNGTHTIRLEYDPGNVTPQARFYVDGVLVETITTDVPSAAAGTMFFGIENANGTPINAVGMPSFAVEV